MKGKKNSPGNLIALSLLIATSIAALLTYSWKRPGPESADGGPHSRPEGQSIPTSALLTTDRPAHTRVSAAYGKLPLSFEANQGQSDPDVQFLARGVGYGLFITPTEAVLSLPPLPAATQCGRSSFPESQSEKERKARGAALRMKLVGANTRPRVSGLEELPGRSNYFIGNDPKQWRRGVRNYAKVRYEAVYPSVDLIYYGNQRQLEYDFVVAPGTDPSAITMAFDGVEKLEVDAQGALVLHTAGGQVRQHRPVIYQEAGGVRQEISGGYTLKGQREVGFQVASYDAARPLVIDPVLDYSTYLGGTSIDEGTGIAVDAAGNAYVTGLAVSPDFPRKHALQGGYGGGQNAFITKLDPTGTKLIYSTFLGGKGNSTIADCLSIFTRFSHSLKDLAHDITLINCDFEEGLDITVDSAGNAYVTGATISPDFPTVNPVQAAIGGGDCGLSRPCADAFVAKISPSGSDLVFSTYLGGSGTDGGIGIAADTSGNAYVTGLTMSPDFPTANALQASFGGIIDAFVAKINSNGSSLAYSTYLGGNAFDDGRGIAVDGSGNAYVTGFTTSLDFPVLNPLQPTKAGGDPLFVSDVFVTKLNAAGSALVYSTYLGGGGGDGGFDIAVDTAGNAYVTGTANSTDFPLMNPLQIVPAGIFVTKLNANGSGLVYSTYLGDSGLDKGSGIAVDAAGNAYVTGVTWSPNFPTANPVQAVFGGLSDGFVVKLNPAGSALVYSTYLGGNSFDEGVGIAVDTAGNAYVAGRTSSPNFPTANPLQAALSGSDFNDAFVVKLR